MIGKRVRLERIMNRATERTVIVPMDHGVAQGPIAGLENVRRAVQEVAEGGANAFIVHKAVAESGHRGRGPDVGLIIHLTAGTSLAQDADERVPVCTVEEAIRYGADGVSIHINLGAATEADMLRHFGEVSASCQIWGMPLLAMMYARGPKIKNSYDVKYVKHAARVGAELGADIVKCNYTGSPDTFREVVGGCPVPVVIAGGPKMATDREVLEMVAGALEAGAQGVSIGRNVFQHKSPRRMTAALCKIVHERASVADALKFLKG